LPARQDQPGAVQGLRPVRGLMPLRRHSSQGIRQQPDFCHDLPSSKNEAAEKRSLLPKTAGRNSCLNGNRKSSAFLCNWCSYGAADLAGVSRMEYPPNIRVIRIPCTGRMSPKFALAPLRGTAPTGCGCPGDIPANAITWKVITTPVENSFCLKTSWNTWVSNADRLHIHGCLRPNPPNSSMWSQVTEAVRAWDPTNTL
jgi:F420-non-reducing hydrogenase iron-sulfur subunit